MAHSLRRPIFGQAGLSASQPISKRFFTESAAQWSGFRQQKQQLPKQKGEKSLKIHSQEQGQSMQMDLGLLPETFIMPSGPNRPSYFSTGIFKLYWHSLKMSGRNFLQMMIWKFADKPYKKISYRQLKPVALGLHRQMYTAFAEGDMKILRKTCADGLVESYLQRLAARPRGETMSWELLRYNGFTKIMSYRAAKMPFEGAGIRQAVVRISSTQRLTRFRNGVQVAGTGKEKDVREYVVIQRNQWGGKEGEWTVWGTTEETTLAKLQEEADKMA